MGVLTLKIGSEKLHGVKDIPLDLLVALIQPV